ncbi:MAG: ABC transporter permease, partial [Tannerella sp.]|nr:ABC transporter permease [Tannerella sp.]
MNFEFFLAKRIHFSREKGDDKRVTPPVVRIAMAGIAIGLAVMIIAVAVVVGFKREVRDKVIGFGGHIQLSNFDNNTSYETVPIAFSDSLRMALEATEGVKHIEAYATKPCIIKTETDFQGVVVRGVSPNFDTTFFRKHLVEGQMITVDSAKSSSNVLLSRTIANMLRLKCGDSFLAYFVDDYQDVRPRKLTVSGLYDTGFADYDKLFVICDIRLVQRINDWDDDMVSGVEVFIHDFNRIDKLTEAIYASLAYRQDRLGNTYYVQSVKELNPMIFNWLGVLDSNVIIILTLIILVAGFTMISGILIIILERANMIGVLKALGQQNMSLRKVFLYVSFFLIVKGMFWGNVIGIAFCLLQSHFRWLKLDPATYYIDSVPVEMNIFTLLLINICSLIVSMVMMLAPSYLIS